MWPEPSKEMGEDENEKVRSLQENTSENNQVNSPYKRAGSRHTASDENSSAVSLSLLQWPNPAEKDPPANSNWGVPPNQVAVRRRQQNLLIQDALGWLDVSRRRYTEVLTPRTSECTLFGNMAFAEGIKITSLQCSFSSKKSQVHFMDWNIWKDQRQCTSYIGQTVFLFHRATITKDRKLSAKQKRIPTVLESGSPRSSSRQGWRHLRAGRESLFQALLLGLQMGIFTFPCICAQISSFYGTAVIRGQGPPEWPPWLGDLYKTLPPNEVTFRGARGWDCNVSSFGGWGRQFNP